MLRLCGLAAVLIGSSFAAIAEPVGQYRSRIIPYEEGFRVQIAANFQAEGLMEFSSKVFFIHPLTGGQMSTKVDWQMTYAIGPDRGDGSHDFDQTLVSAAETPLSQEFVDQYNEDAYCGFTDWEIGVAKDITNLVCDEEDGPIEAGSQSYNIIRWEGDELWLGDIMVGYAADGNNGESPETRPVRFDERLVMRKL